VQYTARHIAIHCNTHCNTLQHTLQYTATHTAIHCNTHCDSLQHTATQTRLCAAAEGLPAMQHRLQYTSTPTAIFAMHHNPDPSTRGGGMALRTLHHTVQYSATHTATHTVLCAARPIGTIPCSTREIHSTRCIAVRVAVYFRVCCRVRCSAIHCNTQTHKHT